MKIPMDIIKDVIVYDSVNVLRSYVLEELGFYDIIKQLNAQHHSGIESHLSKDIDAYPVIWIDLAKAYGFKEKVDPSQFSQINQVLRDRFKTETFLNLVWSNYDSCSGLVDEFIPQFDWTNMGETLSNIKSDLDKIIAIIREYSITISSVTKVG